MKLIITFFVSVAVFLFVFPVESIHFTNRLRRIGKGKEQIKYQNFDNKIIESLIRLSKFINRYITPRISPIRYQKIEQQLIYANEARQLSVEDFWILKFIMAIFSSLLFGLLYLANGDSSMRILMAVAGIMGFFVPDNWLHAKVKNRKMSMQREAPYLLSIFAILTDAGLNILQAIDEATRNLNGELASEFRKALEEVSLGISYSESFESLAKKCDIEEISYFVSALVQGLEKGNSGLSKVIREHARDSWSKRKARSKELAEKASMKLFMPLLLFVLPSLVIFLLGPMIFSMLDMLK